MNNNINKEMCKFRKIHYKNYNGSESWEEYDKNGNITHNKYSDGYEGWYKYDINGNRIRFKNTYEYEG